ncbi:unnamed protein product [Rotaria sordida]|uniref:BED-type domain-containing protein n=1 Tax=Rotaria sordida TaxID=392033 RepID=A0A819TVG5_9BILA|nr:unnamed protein product [Rotaria sordida]CAF4093380.1 unnamed protein product [Rotaria sordida]
MNSSPLWEHFHQIFVNNSQQQFVSCNECKTLLAFTSTNGTNNLKSHLNSCSRTTAQLNDSNQTTVHEFYSSTKKIKISKKIKLSVVQACTEFSALDARAFDTMKGYGFQNLAQVLFDAGRSFANSSIQVQDVLPHPTTISRNVGRMYEQSKAQLIKICEKIKSFCIVVDSWTEKFTGINYCGIALRFIDDNHRLLSFILGCYAYDAPSHSAMHFRAFVDSKLNEYNLQLDLSKFVVCDNEVKMLAAFRDNCTRIGCFDHYLNKQLQHAFESTEIHTNKNTIEKVNCATGQNVFFHVKKIVTHVRRSHRQQHLSMKLQIYSETRFNGAMSMLDIFRNVFYELPMVLTNTKFMDNYNLIDKQALDDICHFLQPFGEVIEALSEDQRPSLHRVIPLRQCLIIKCEITEEDSIAIAELKLFIAHRMKTVWLISNEHRLATILHPKLKNFESCYDEKERAISALKLAFDKYQLNNSSSACVLGSNQVISSISSNTDTNIASLKGKKLLIQCFDAMVNSNVKTPNSHQEIEDYLNSEFSYNYNENECEDDDIDILSYWRDKQNQFPVLSALAKEIHAIPASNTIIERLFSASKSTITEKRTNLASEKLNQLLFLQKNLILLKQLSQENKRKRTISMSSTNTMSSEDSTCTMPKLSRIDDDNNYSSSDDIEILFD